MMLKILVIIMIMMRSSVVVRLMASRLDPSVQFSTEIAEVEETDGMVNFLVIRSGNLSFWTVVRCYTTQLSAFADEDFMERPQSEESEILFSPGEKEQTCSVVIIDDFRFEGDETFILNLGLPEPSEDNPVKLGDNSAIRVRISDVEDAPTVQLEMESYSIKVHSDTEDKFYGMLNVVRSGDLKGTSSVRINTRVETAKAGIDYIPNSEMLYFKPGVAVKLFQVEILRSEIKTGHRTFLVFLDKALNATLGLRSSAKILISDHDQVESSLILPSSPVVVSLMYYDDAVMGSKINPSPGYPLVCISPCNFNHPKHESLKVFCRDLEDVEISYIWQVADSSKSIGEHLHYEQITLATPFTTADMMVLDSVYFRSNFIIRCVAQPWKDSVKGIPLPSEPVTIDAQKDICRAASFEGLQVMFQSQAFTATLNYIDPKDSHHPNRVHIHLEIPHQDGMIPFISTSPLPNQINLLSDAVIRRQHQCSNMFPANFVKNQTGFLTESRLIAQHHVVNIRPHQFDESLRGVETVLLYQHLDLDGCKWEFDGWFQMSELATSCGGIISSGSQRRESGKTYVTVKVPLYVSYISSMEPTGWRTVEHRTEMETSFYYNGILWKNAIRTENAGESKLQIKRVATRTDGRLLVEFQTNANFRGLYVMEHATSDRKSQLLSRNALVTFNLSLLWSENTFDGPIQRWKAISSHSLKDYTGKYNLELLPCVVGPKQVYSSFIRNITCRISSMQRFTVPIVFKQNPQPVSVVYSLNTVFQLLNNERIFLANPFDEPNNHWDMDFKGAFTKGDNVYGRVMWQADQNLDGAYKLTIQQVYICSGQSGYIPTFDPTGEMYNEGSHFGCLENNSKLKHRFLILDRSDSEDAVDKFPVPLKAKFASDDRNFTALDDVPGVDGFSFQVDALYSVSAGHQWYLQVLYTIGPSVRYKRSTLMEGKSSSRNGTNMHVLVLAPQQSGRSSQKEQEDKGGSSWTRLMTVVTTSLVVVCVVLLVAVVLCVVAWRRWKSLKRIEMRLRLKEVTTTSTNLNDPFGQSSSVNSGTVRLNSQVRVDNAVVRTLPVKIHNNLSEGTEV